MPRSLAELLDLLQAERITENTFRGGRPRTHFLRIFGGQLIGHALAAAAQTVDGDGRLLRTAHSMHMYFLHPGDPGDPVTYEVERVRDDASFNVRLVAGRQNGRRISCASVSFHRCEPGIQHQDEMPAAPPPAYCPTLGEVVERISGRSAAAFDREWGALEVRYVGDGRDGGLPVDDTRPAQARLWIRAAGRLPDEPALHQRVLAYLSDFTLLSSALIPHGVHIGAPGLQTASLDHAIWFHQPCRADEWLLFDQSSPSAAGSRGLAFGRLFSADGDLTASVMQEGLIRYRVDANEPE